MEKLQYIFCSQCGQKIKSDSLFCKYCGAKVDDVNKNIEITSKHSIKNENVKVEETEYIKIINHCIVKKRIVANEIVANVKMIGIAILVWIVYILCFIVYHLKDSAPITEQEPYFGQSCYDSVMVFLPNHYELSWEECLFNKINDIDSNGLESLKYLVSLEPEISDIEKAHGIAEIKGINDEQFERYKQDAIQEAKRNRDSYYEYLTEIRQTAYKDDLDNNMKMAAVISLCLMIIGRYLILVFKWVKRNKT